MKHLQSFQVQNAINFKQKCYSTRSKKREKLNYLAQLMRGSFCTLSQRLYKDMHFLAGNFANNTFSTTYTFSRDERCKEESHCTQNQKDISIH